jgi:hypothetical protein
MVELCGFGVWLTEVLVAENILYKNKTMYETMCDENGKLYANMGLFKF